MAFKELGFNTEVPQDGTLASQKHARALAQTVSNHCRQLWPATPWPGKSVLWRMWACCPDGSVWRGWEGSLALWSYFRVSTTTASLDTVPMGLPGTPLRFARVNPPSKRVKWEMPLCLYHSGLQTIRERCLVVTKTLILRPRKKKNCEYLSSPRIWVITASASPNYKS